jgi:hypothetical protein
VQDERRYENDDLTGTGWNAQCRSARLTRPDVSSPGSIWDVGKFRSPADEAVFRRWRLGFFVFYGAMALSLIGGTAMFPNRPENGALSATAASNPAPILAEAARRPH